MIQCSFLHSNGICVGFELCGHTGQYGQSILCAAVSSAAYLTVNAITDVLHIPADVDEKDGQLLLRVSVKDEQCCRSFFAALRLHLENLEEQYPKHIHMSDKEV